MAFDDERYQRARRRAGELRGFYLHIGIYLIVMAALFTINMLTNRDVLWFYWPLIGWGVGVAIHALVVVSSGRFLGEAWEDRKARELMQRDKDSERAA
jgi:hypothetical protein